MKKLFISFILLFSLASCMYKPEEVVTRYLENIKIQNIEQAYKYVISEDVTKEDLKIKYSNNIQKMFFEKLFENLEYEILNSVEQEDQSVIVNVMVENIDIRKLFDKVYKNVFIKAFSGEKAKNIEDEFINAFKSSEIEKYREITQFKVIKTKKGNKIELSFENIDILFGKYYSTINNLNEIGRQ